MTDSFSEKARHYKNTYMEINEVYDGKGQISHEDALKKAGVYKQLRIQQDRDYVANFDEAMSKCFKLNGSNL